MKRPQVTSAAIFRVDRSSQQPGHSETLQKVLDEQNEDPPVVDKPAPRPRRHVENAPPLRPGALPRRIRTFSGLTQAQADRAADSILRVRRWMRSVPTLAAAAGAIVTASRFVESGSKPATVIVVVGMLAVVQGAAMYLVGSLASRIFLRARRFEAPVLQAFDAALSEAVARWHPSGIGYVNTAKAARQAAQQLRKGRLPGGGFSAD